MRLERIIQATTFEVFAQHKIGCALKAMLLWLDRQRALLSLVASDLRGSRAAGDRKRGTASRGGSTPSAAQARPAAELRRAGVSS
jgi:hypothetical protein